MGNAQPTNKTGRKVIQQKLENAKKTNILSLSEHKLDSLPLAIFQISTLKTLDVSNNVLKSLKSSKSSNNNNNNASIVDIDTFQQLKTFNCENNKLGPGSLESISNLSKLQVLKAGGNLLGITRTATANNKKKGGVGKNNSPTATTSSLPLPSSLPSTLKQIVLNRNGFEGSIPTSIFTSSLLKLEKLDLSSNSIRTIQKEIMNLKSLSELKLDENYISSLPKEIGNLSKLKTLSLKQNSISSPKGKDVQSLPSELFTDTLLIDLNLHGNPLTSTQLNNEFDGYDKFLERRQKVKTNAIYGGAMTNLDVCGLE